MYLPPSIVVPSPSYYIKCDISYDIWRKIVPLSLSSFISFSISHVLYIRAPSIHGYRCTLCNRFCNRFFFIVSLSVSVQCTYSQSRRKYPISVHGISHASTYVPNITYLVWRMCAFCTVCICNMLGMKTNNGKKYHFAKVTKEQFFIYSAERLLL